MKNDLPPSCHFRNCWTINCESNLHGQMFEHSGIHVFERIIWAYLLNLRENFKFLKKCNSELNVSWLNYKAKCVLWRHYTSQNCDVSVKRQTPISLTTSLATRRRRFTWRRQSHPSLVNQTSPIRRPFCAHCARSEGLLAQRARNGRRTGGVWFTTLVTPSCARTH